jgi:alpha-1,2-mannosyltransferase
LSVAAPSARARGGRAVSVAVWAATIAVCGVLPLISLAYVAGDVVVGSGIAPDFSYYYSTAEKLLDGEGIYPEGEFHPTTLGFVLEYVYPPLTAVVVAPFTALPLDAAGAAFCIVLFLLLVASLALAGVRDWRCYGLAFLWPPALDALQTGNITILLVFITALAWRFRDRAAAAGASLGVGLALKLVLWPLVLWLVATRRLRGALWAILAGLVVLVASWAAVRFDGLGEYPDLLRRLAEIMERESYSLYALGVDLGLPSEAARVLWFALAACILTSVVVMGRRGDDRVAFVLALAAVVACSPIVWLHYFTFILLAVAIARPRLSLVWFIGIPMQLVVETGAYNGSTFQTAAVLALAALAIVLALRDPLVAAPERVATPSAVAGSP